MTSLNPENGQLPPVEETHETHDDEDNDDNETSISIGGKAIVYLNKKGKPLKHPAKSIRTPAQLAALERGRQKLAEKRASDPLFKPKPDDGMTKEQRHEKLLEERRRKVAEREQARIDAINNAKKSVEELQAERQELERVKQEEMARVRAIRELREAQRVEMERQHAAELEAVKQENRARKELRQREMINELTTRIQEKYEELYTKQQLEKLERRNQKEQSKMMKQFARTAGVPYTASFQPHTQPCLLQASQQNHSNRSSDPMLVAPDPRVVPKPFVLRGFECEAR
jgi:DNA repair exonuclease SbcCD ATPase subunit